MGTKKTTITIGKYDNGEKGLDTRVYVDFFFSPTNNYYVIQAQWFGYFHEKGYDNLDDAGHDFSLIMKAIIEFKK